MPGIPEKFIESGKKCGYDSILFKTSKTPHLFVESDKILSLKGVPGVEMETETEKDTIKIKMRIKEKIKQPIFLCFGILKEQGKQLILPEITLEKDSEATVFAHCTFPDAKNILHQMEMKIKLGENARFIYEERHYHGEFYGGHVFPIFKAELGRNSYLKTDFILNQGTVGKLEIDFLAELKEKAVCEVTSKVIGQGKEDDFKVKDKVILAGEGARSLIKIRAAAVNGGKVFGQGETIALAKDSRGHVDCQEIVVGENSIAQAVPIVDVRHPEARVTHEASVGKINQKELETLLTRGLSEKQATEFIIRGKIR